MENKTAAHTPTPWQYNAAGKRDGTALWANLYQENNHEIIAHMDQGNKLANAAFIVKAVNCHEELISLLKETRELGKTETAWKIWDTLRDKAIAKAEGR